MSIIINIHARQILDSRGNPTVEVDVTLKTDLLEEQLYHLEHLLENMKLLSYAMADHLYGKRRFKAVENVNAIISSRIVGCFMF